MATNKPDEETTRYAHLRAAAAQAKQRTIARLQQAIAAIEERGDRVTTATIKQESGLDYSAYYRNDAAYALYREHAAHFKPQSRPTPSGRRHRASPTMANRETPARVRQARDPLLAYTRAELVTKIRTAWAARDAARAERDDALRRYDNLLRAHLQCAETIFTLETRLVQYEEQRGYLKRTLEEREHHP